ncbi:MAG: helicase-related protein [Thermoplasmata archaeon]
MPTVEHPRVRPGKLEDRRYQADIAEVAFRRNTLVVLPTGLGKTAIALRVSAETLERYPADSILFLAPTRPLVVQHARSIADALIGPEPLVLTGAITPERRSELVRPPQIVVATPQVIANDLVRGEISLDPFRLIVFDEAHRAVGDYPYVAIGRANADGRGARTLAMTASPGSRKGRIEEVWYNLHLDHFEYRTELSPDVVPYIHSIGVETVEVAVPAEVQHLAVLLKSVAARPIDRLARAGLLAPGDSSRRSLLEVGGRLHRELAAYRARGEAAPASVWAAVTAQAIAMKALHALELAESQGVEALRAFLARQAAPERGRITPAQRAFLADPDLEELRRRLTAGVAEHPKLATAARIVRAEVEAHPAARVIVFSQYRDTVDRLVQELSKDPMTPVRPARFVGQATHGGDVGLSQKEQVGLLDRFRSGVVNCLVATSVAEEGLDIPSTDLVVFYEPIPDVIRTIQRRGRTGRARAGRAVVLVAQGTRDEGLHRAAFARERRMHTMLEEVEDDARAGAIRPPPTGPSVQTMLDEFEG